MDRIRSKVSSGFKTGKCKTSLKLAVARIKLLKNKRETQVRQMRRDLAQLLESGQDQTARIRVEHVIREEKTVSAYELIEIYCELIVARLPIIEAQKNCPIDLKEAIAGLVFASPRCADLPELMDIRKHFVSKYGKEFVTAALEVRPECGVNRMLVEKLSAKAPDIEAKIHTLTAVAQEHNVKWDSNALEEEFNKPSADLLNGPSRFGSASKMPIESTNSNLSSATNQKNDSTVNSYQNDAVSKPISTNTVSPADNNSHSASVSSTSQHGSRAPGYTPSQPVWHMDFKDATSAAQAAAESAEMASMAARAAVQLATRESVSRQSSIESHELSSDDIRRNQPVKSTTSTPGGVDIVRGSTTKEDESRRSQGMNVDDHNRQRDNASQRRESESIYRDPASKHMSNSSSQSRGNVSSQPSTRTQGGMNLDDHNHQRDEAGQRRESESIYRDPASKHMSSSSSQSRGSVSSQPSTGTQGMNLDDHTHQRDEAGQRRESETIYRDPVSKHMSSSSSQSRGNVTRQPSSGTQGMNLDDHNLQRDEAGQRSESENIYSDPASKHMSSSSSQSRGNVSRQFSTGSQDLRHNKPAKSTSSKLDDADFIHVTNEEDELRSQAMNLEEQSLQMDEVSRRETKSIYDDRASPKGRPMSRSSSDSSGTSLTDNLPEMDFFKTDTNAYDHHANKDRIQGNVNSESGRWSTEESYNKSPSSHFTRSAVDTDVFGGSTIRKQGSNSSNDSRTGNREGIFGTDKKQPSFKSDAGAVFDNYGSDTDDVNLFDSFLPHEEEPSPFSSNIDVFSAEQHRSDSLGGSKQHFATKQLSVNNSRTAEDEFRPSYFGRLGSETTEETLNSPVSSGYKENRETVQKSADKIWERSSSGDLPSRRNDKMPMESIDLDRPIYDYSNEEPRAWQPSKASETLETDEKDKFGMPPSHSHASATEISGQSNFETEQSLNLGRLTGGFKNKGFQRPPYVKTSPGKTSSVDASLLSPQTSKDTPFIVEKPSVTPSGNVYPNPDEYVYNSRISKTVTDTDLDKDNELVSSRTSATKTLKETPFIVEKPSVTSSSNAYANPEEYVYSSRISKTGMDTDLDKDNKLVSSRTSARRGYRGKASLPSENTTEVADDIVRTPRRNELSSNSSTSSNIEKIDLRRRAVGSRESRQGVSVQPEPSRYVPPAAETAKVELYEQRPHKMVSEELGSRDPLTYFKPDEDESLELNKPQIVGRAKKDIKLSWRTRNPPSDGTKNSHSRATSRLEAENKPSQASDLSEMPPITTYSTNLEEKVTPRSLLPKSSTEQPPVARIKSESSADSGVGVPNSPKLDSSQPVVPEKMLAASSIDGSISRESSFGNASHVHPKLPDSDSFTAYFKSLRANKQ